MKAFITNFEPFGGAVGMFFPFSSLQRVRRGAGGRSRSRTTR